MPKILENEIVKLTNDLSKIVDSYAKALKKLRKKLKKCSHFYTVLYYWEHDNGYGKQTTNEGKRCLACLAVCPWSGLSENWTDPEYGG